jgi:hypothetical protein
MGPSGFLLSENGSDKGLLAKFGLAIKVWITTFGESPIYY